MVTHLDLKCQFLESTILNILREHSCFLKNIRVWLSNAGFLFFERARARSLGFQLLYLCWGCERTPLVTRQLQQVERAALST